MNPLGGLVPMTQDYEIMLKGLAEVLAFEQLKVVILCRRLAQQEQEHQRALGESQLRMDSLIAHIQDQEKERLFDAR